MAGILIEIGVSWSRVKVYDEMMTVQIDGGEYADNREVVAALCRLAEHLEDEDRGRKVGLSVGRRWVNYETGVPLEWYYSSNKDRRMLVRALSVVRLLAKEARV